MKKHHAEFEVLEVMLVLLLGVYKSYTHVEHEDLIRRDDIKAAFKIGDDGKFAIPSQFDKAANSVRSIIKWLQNEVIKDEKTASDHLQCYLDALKHLKKGELKQAVYLLSYNQFIAGKRAIAKVGGVTVFDGKTTEEIAKEVGIGVRRKQTEGAKEARKKSSQIKRGADMVLIERIAKDIGWGSLLRGVMAVRVQDRLPKTHHLKNLSPNVIERRLKDLKYPTDRTGLRKIAS